MRTLQILLCLTGVWACSCNTYTEAPSDAGSSADAATDAGDLAQPAAPCRAAQGLTGTPIMGWCIDMDKMPALTDWNLASQISACPVMPGPAGWALAGSGMMAALRPASYQKSGSSAACAFRLPDIIPGNWAGKTRLRIAIEHVYQPGTPATNSYAVIELLGTPATTLLYPTSTAPGQPSLAHFDVDVARLPPAGNVPIEFRLYQSSPLTAAPTWEIRSLAVLVE